MKLTCRCGQDYVYDDTKAGQQFACAWCKQSIVMPSFQSLAVEDQVQYRGELKKQQEKLEKQRQRAAAKAEKQRAREAAIEEAQKRKDLIKKRREEAARIQKENEPIKASQQEQVTATTRNCEMIIWKGHPSALYYLKHWIAGALLLPFLGVGLILIIYAVLDRKARVFTYSNKRVMSEAGIISRTTREVTLADIRSINMQQSVLERIFGLGSIQIGSAGTAGIEVEFSGIPNPVDVRDAIRRSKDSTS